MNIWKQLKSKHKPFLVLAPMADVTDIAFRQIIAKHSRHGKPNGGPDLFFTEFVSADGLVSEKGQPKLLPNLKYNKKEKPIIAQIFGSKPENLKKAAQLIESLGFDGIDINMGCPDKKIEKQGAGASLIKNPKLAIELIKATQAGVKKISISVKTRIGYNHIATEDWIKQLISAKPAAITIHGRTRKEMSEVPAHWDEIKKAVQIANGSGIVIIGNGDVASLQDAQAKYQASKVDGIMIGRGIFGNPWFFDQDFPAITIKRKLLALTEHTKLFEKYLTGIKNFDCMKKHFKAYVTGFDGAKELRISLMEANSAYEIENLIDKFLNAQRK
ncbi:MAG: tRNA-dihydrouridine synthase [Candidatus Falkowbacteria bacterium]|nr:tRNA-dihydrouridine synthase [Candidatus Falkowbacteria bacterium]